MASSPPPKIAIAAPKMGVDPLNSLNPESPLSSINQDGTQLWPDLMPRLDSEPRVGTLLVMRDKADRKTKVHLPWATSASNPVRHVQRVIAQIRDAAGLPPDITFTSFRMAVTPMQLMPD